MVKRKQYIKPSKLTQAQMMQRMREARREEGLVEFRVWATPENKIKLKALLAELEKDD